MKFRVTALLLIHALGFSALPASAEDGTPDARSFVFPQVQKAWDEGGFDGVKDWMRAMVERSKQAGLRIPSTGKKLKCGSCHDDLKQYPLSANALEDLTGLLAAAASEPATR